MLIEQRLRLHDHAGDAMAALHRLLIDEILLQRMRMRRSAKAFERRYGGVADWTCTGTPCSAASPRRMTR